MAKVELKQPIVEEIANNIKDAQAVVLVDYSGLTVATPRTKTNRRITALRKNLIILSPLNSLIVPPLHGTEVFPV